MLPSARPTAGNPGLRCEQAARAPAFVLITVLLYELMSAPDDEQGPLWGRTSTVPVGGPDYGIRVARDVLLQHPVSCGSVLVLNRHVYLLDGGYNPATGGSAVRWNTQVRRMAIYLAAIPSAADGDFLSGAAPDPGRGADCRRGPADLAHQAAS